MVLTWELIEGTGYKTKTLNDMKELLDLMKQIEDTGRISQDCHMTIFSDGSGEFCKDNSDVIFEFNSIDEALKKAESLMQVIKPI